MGRVDGKRERRNLKRRFQTSVRAMGKICVLWPLLHVSKPQAGPQLASHGRHLTLPHGKNCTQNLKSGRTVRQSQETVRI